MIEFDFENIIEVFAASKDIIKMIYLLELKIALASARRTLYYWNQPHVFQCLVAFWRTLYEVCVATDSDL